MNIFKPKSFQNQTNLPKTTMDFFRKPLFVASLIIVQAVMISNFGCSPSGKKGAPRAETPIPVEVAPATTFIVKTGDNISLGDLKLGIGAQSSRYGAAGEPPHNVVQLNLGKLNPSLPEGGSIDIETGSGAVYVVTWVSSWTDGSMRFEITPPSSYKGEPGMRTNSGGNATAI